jgi:hypothetical protein
VVWFNLKAILHKPISNQTQAMKMFSIASALLLAASLLACTETGITPARTAERTTTTAPATSYTAGSETATITPTDSDNDAPTKTIPAPTKPVPAPVQPVRPITVVNP